MGFLTTYAYLIDGKSPQTLPGNLRVSEIHDDWWKIIAELGNKERKRKRRGEREGERERERKERKKENSCVILLLVLQNSKLFEKKFSALD